MEVFSSQIGCQKSCLICGDEVFQTVLSRDGPNMTSDSRLIDMPLVKEQCKKCGYVRSDGFSGSALSQFYEQNYTLAEDQMDAIPKHFTEAGVISKFQSQANWVIRSLPEDFFPSKCLEIGCGAGDLIEELMKFWPNCEFVGVEPNSHAKKTANSKGLKVYASISEVSDVNFDISISFAVIEHLAEPGSLFDLGMKLRDTGVVVVVQPVQEGSPMTYSF